MAYCWSCYKPFLAELNIKPEKLKKTLKMSMRTRIKICGMTCPKQVRHAVECGVDAIGVILYAKSPRAISLEQAASIRSVVPAFVSLVGVFVNANKEFIEQAADRLQLDLIQLHGDESDEFGQSLSRPFIKAIRAKNAQQVRAEIVKFPNASAILLDPYVEGQHGGTGQVLDTDLWPDQLQAKEQTQAIILAGGLSVDNVVGRVSNLSPFAIDMNSGLEDSPGDKNSQRVSDAIKLVRQADAEVTTE